jgi:phosphatidate cytidylyltransferase
MASRRGRPGAYDLDEEEPPRGRRRRSDTTARVLAALPAIAFAITIVVAGGIWWALGIAGLGLICLHELYGMTERVRPVKLAGFLAVIALPLAALYAEPFQVVLVLACLFPVTFVLAVMRPRREHVSWATAVTLFGALWIGLAMAHAVWLRELNHGGAFVVCTLLGTFIGDTAAYFGGRSWGRTPLAPLISPNKTLEGLIAGIAGGTFAFWLYAFAYHHDWLAGWDAALIGLSVAIAAPFGDLFESMLKRDLEVKDTGRFFGAHGGALDRLDAVLFTVPTAYYVAVALGY